MKDLTGQNTEENNESQVQTMHAANPYNECFLFYWAVGKDYSLCRCNVSHWRHLRTGWGTQFEWSTLVLDTLLFCIPADMSHQGYQAQICTCWNVWRPLFPENIKDSECNWTIFDTFFCCKSDGKADTRTNNVLFNYKWPRVVVIRNHQFLTNTSLLSFLFEGS